MIDFTLGIKPIKVDIEVNNDKTEIGMSVDSSSGGGGTKDYRKLKNKPTINGTELYDNYDEIDPTVPEWAKAENKPTYTAEEVGAIDEDDEMSFATVKEVWDSIFNKEND